MDPPNPRDRMSIDSPSPSRKRGASVLSSGDQATSNSTTPGLVILSRQHHRRANIAASTWGPSIPLTLSTAFPHPDSAKPASTTASSSSAHSGPFNIYPSLLTHPTLFPYLVLSLPLYSALALYAIDKRFHYLFNKYYVSLIHSYAQHHCPVASHVFSWSMYPELCISDPLMRPMDSREWLARDVPGWRWVGMCIFRQTVVRSILTKLAIAGHRVPTGVEVSLYKFWVLMETPTTAVRTAYLQDSGIWTDLNIRHFSLFLVKLDMYFSSNPILGTGPCSLSHLLMSKKSLSTLHHVLSGKITLTYDTTTDMLIRTYLTSDLDTDAFSWLDDEIDNGIPEEYWGILMREDWDSEGERMECAVDMVVAEGVRRELHVQKHLLDFVMYGHVDNDGKNEKVVRRWRGDRKTVKREGWPGVGVREKTIKELDQKFRVVKRGKSGVDMMDAMDLSL